MSYLSTHQVAKKLHFHTTRAAAVNQEKAMTDYTNSTSEIIARNKARASFGQRLILWIENRQQLRADREISQILRRARV
jgi:hypothetical protein